MLSGFSWLEEHQVAGMGRPGSLRPLEEDLRVLKAVGMGAVVSLTEVTLDREMLQAEDLDHFSAPVPDFQPPSLPVICHTIEFIEVSLKKDRPVVVHCTAGLGRTGTILACWLVSRGEPPDTAINRVRAARPGSIETWEQEESVFEYAAFLLKGSDG